MSMHNIKKNLQFGKISRRSFIQTSATLAGASAVAGSIALPFSAQAKIAATMPDETSETITYSACLVNCGSRCPLKVHVKDNVIRRISNETFFDDSSVVSPMRHFLMTQPSVNTRSALVSEAALFVGKPIILTA